MTASSEKVNSLENEVEDLQVRLVTTETSSFAAGFRSYVTGFLAVDPEYEWSKFVKGTCLAYLYLRVLTQL